MEVYEKAIWIARGVLGFIALRELLLYCQSFSTRASAIFCPVWPSP